MCCEVDLMTFLNLEIKGREIGHVLHQTLKVPFSHSKVFPLPMISKTKQILYNYVVGGLKIMMMMMVMLMISVTEATVLQVVVVMAFHINWVTRIVLNASTF
ncbi:hypothetical protein V8G54_012220 [Vigna mungo]|uniref:Uncharacterized protein n=1 Tax=Vigna mungo TaxID=3915 RepID=A0AAQ3NR49_VIGMU